MLQLALVDIAIQPPSRESEKLVFCLLCNFTGKDTSSFVKQLFHIDRQDYGDDRKISGQRTSTNEHFSLSDLLLCERPICLENHGIGHVLLEKRMN